MPPRSVYQIGAVSLFSSTLSDTELTNSAQRVWELSFPVFVIIMAVLLVASRWHCNGSRAQEKFFQLNKFWMFKATWSVFTEIVWLPHCCVSCSFSPSKAATQFAFSSQTVGGTILFMCKVLKLSKLQELIPSKSCRCWQAQFYSHWIWPKVKNWARRRADGLTNSRIQKNVFKKVRVQGSHVLLIAVQIKMTLSFSRLSGDSVSTAWGEELHLPLQGEDNLILPVPSS